MFGKLAGAAAALTLGLGLGGAAQAATTLNLVSDGEGGYSSQDFYWPGFANGETLNFTMTVTGLTFTSGSVSVEGEVYYRLWDPVAGNDLPFATNTYDTSFSCGSYNGCLSQVGSSVHGSVATLADISNPCSTGTPLFTTCTQEFRFRFLVGDFYFKPDGSGQPISATLDFSRGGGGGPISAVPEPSTWAMMIIGFGAAGTLLRRGRRQSNFA